MPNPTIIYRIYHLVNVYRLSAILVLGFILILSSGCRPEKKSDKVVFRYNHTSPLFNLDPAFAKSQNGIWAANHLYETLFSYDQNMEIKKNLIKSYSVNDEGTEYTFELLDSIYFHKNTCFKNGRKQLTSVDVRYSWLRLISAELQAPGSWVLDDLIDSSSFTIQDDLRFSLSLNQPSHTLLHILTMPYTSIVPEEAVNTYGTILREHAVGTGPFTLKRMIAGEAIFFEKNDDERFNDIKIDAIKASYITDKNVAFLELLNNKIDYMSGIESAFGKRVFDAAGNLSEDYSGKVNFDKNTYLNTEYIGINPRVGSVLEQKEFRQALNYAIDRATLVKVFRNHIGFPGDGGVTHPGLWTLLSERPHGYTYDPTLAQSLIDKSGYHTSYDSEELIIETNADYLDIITFVARQWEQVGVKVKIELQESSMLRQRMRSGDVNLFRASWIADFPDPENFLSLFYGKNGAPPNYTRFKNQSFDKSYEDLLSTPLSNPQRKVLASTLESILIEESPIIFLFYDASAIFSSKNFSGYQFNALNDVIVDSLTVSVQED